MAYIKPEQVKSIRDQIKKAYPNYKWSVTRRHHSTVVIILQESDLPVDTHMQVNQYYLKESEKLTTKGKLIFQHILEICNSVESCYDRNAGDPYADYGDSSYFIDLDIGQWDKPHKIILADCPRHPKARVGRILTTDEIERGQAECKATRIKCGIEKALVDLQEEYDPNLPYIDGADLDGAAWEQDEIKLHNENLIAAVEQEQLESIREGFPEYPEKPTIPPGFVSYLNLSIVEESV
jgi:hypothetical protein